LIYVSQNTALPTETWIPIVFSPTGDIDDSRTNSSHLLLANTILRPTTTLLQEYLGSQFDIWELINWIWVSFYWMMLFDFGQVTPTTYSPAGNVLLEGSPIVIPTFTLPATFHPPTNNIFINETLFEIYSEYFREISMVFNVALPEFSALNDTNRLQPVETGFLRSYSCLKREWKGALSGIISVLAADYALFFGAYSIIIFFAGVRHVV
jgi:hypothetical protein